MSQCIDAAVQTLGADALSRLVTTQKMIIALINEDDEDV
jgi:hypothetical protein